MSCCKKNVPEIKSEMTLVVVVCFVVFKTTKKFKTESQSADLYLDNVKLHACFQKIIYL